ncbi:MAG: alpha-L-fucosidase, partial [Clostridiales bacterium]|nr:alpha-L-fucosidase [Clostridiales bacterium]
MDNKFGLFIHWGLYSIPAVHEQVLTNGDWPHDKYEALVCEFDPYRYDPDEWVSMAKNACMRYICFTAKHHDGFCMWDTKETDYKITNTPYGKDTLKMLADACSRHDVALSIYYSIPDWHHPHAYNPLSSHQWKAKEKENNDFSIYK